MDYEKMSCIDILLKVLYSCQNPKENDSLSKDEMEKAMTIAVEKYKEESKINKNK